MFAPSLAGVLAGIALVGIGGGFIVAALFSVGAFVLLLRCPAGAEPRATSTARPLAEIMDGIRYVAARPHLRRLVLSSFVIIMFGFNYVAFVPALVKGEFDLSDGWVGLIMSASSIGAVIVAVPLAGRADGAGVWRLMVISGVCVRARSDGTRTVAGVLHGVRRGGLRRCGNHRLSVVVQRSMSLNMTEDTDQGPGAVAR